MKKYLVDFFDDQYQKNLEIDIPKRVWRLFLIGEVACLISVAPVHAFAGATTPDVMVATLFVFLLCILCAANTMIRLISIMVRSVCAAGPVIRWIFAGNNAADRWDRFQLFRAYNQYKSSQTCPIARERWVWSYDSYATRRGIFVESGQNGV